MLAWKWYCVLAKLCCKGRPAKPRRLSRGCSWLFKVRLTLINGSTFLFATNPYGLLELEIHLRRYQLNILTARSENGLKLRFPRKFLNASGLYSVGLLMPKTALSSSKWKTLTDSWSEGLLWLTNFWILWNQLMVLLRLNTTAKNDDKTDKRWWQNT